MISGLAVTPAVASPARSGTTLITGDHGRVVTRPGKLPDVVIKPAPGRERMPFLKTVMDGTVSVIPFDAQPLVNNGVLDLKLFDVGKPQRNVIVRYRDHRSRLTPTANSSYSCVTAHRSPCRW